MSMELWEYENEEAMDALTEELYENELKDRAIEEFTKERLTSFYYQNPNILINSFKMLNEAKLILGSSPSASLLLSCASIEVSIKVGILKPIIFGFIHSDIAAGIIADTAIKQTGLDRFRDLLAKLISDVASIDIKSFKRANATKTLWNERSTIQKIRNNISHRAIKCGHSEAQASIVVAETVLLQLIPDILSALNLKINSQGEVVESE